MERAPRKFRYYLLLACLMLTASASLAEPASDKVEEQKRAQIAARMKQLRSDMLRKDVGLDSVKAGLAEGILERYALERRKLKTQLRSQHHALGDLLENTTTDDATYLKAVRALRAADAKLMVLRERELDEVSRLMTPKQQARFMVSVRKMQHRLREALRAYRPGEE